jgi:hypothetical protein
VNHDDIVEIYGFRDIDSNMEETTAVEIGQETAGATSTGEPHNSDDGVDARDDDDDEKEDDDDDDDSVFVVAEAGPSNRTSRDVRDSGSLRLGRGIEDHLPPPRTAEGLKDPKSVIYHRRRILGSVDGQRGPMGRLRPNGRFRHWVLTQQRRRAPGPIPGLVKTCKVYGELSFTMHSTR